MIEIDDVSVRLGENAILDGVTTTIEDGQFVGLVGPNGAGKTTLLRTIHGVLTPDRGEVRVAGDSVSSLASKETSRRVAVVPQDTTLSFDFPVEDVVAMGRHPYRSRFSGPSDGGESDRERVQAAMERTEVDHFADRSITAVSGGERQRVLLARALAQDTPALLLDEPTASLDINHQVRTLELVRELANEDGKTVVAAIHDLNLAAHYCDELRLLAGGEIQASGDPEAVLAEDHLEAAFDTRAVVSSHPVTGSTYVTALPERPTESEGRVHVVGGGGTVSRLLYVLSAAGYEVSVGALNEGDSDLETARSLGLDAVTEEPFAPVGDEARRAVEDRIRRADATVLADVEVGAGNLANLRAAREADSVVVVEERPFAERNYAGSDAAALYRELSERGRVVGPDELLSAVEAAVAGPGERPSAQVE
ncbi:heme ABC transporter ATP-binding protein [Halorussus pelagicus]|uniref:heme ABC transporter ATP-binding protein n=1 Tax=Halorussus pelagicus TaxID=2505977 RepID=UPI000FFBBDB9|nr:heme ABC transporter ATP-binding protein [Halorussus pelagicus]